MQPKRTYFTIFLGSLFLIIIFTCQTLPELDGSLNVSKGTVYGKAHETDKQEIEALFQKMVQAVLNKNLLEISNDIHPKQGIWVDLKAQWTKEEFVKSFEEVDNYFEIYFYSTNKLRQKKQNDSSWSVRDILILSRGIRIDYYFDAKDECELDLLFEANQELEGDLANPVFRKQGGRWYIYRLF